MAEDNQSLDDLAGVENYATPTDGALAEIRDSIANDNTPFGASAGMAAQARDAQTNVMDNSEPDESNNTGIPNTVLGGDLIGSSKDGVMSSISKLGKVRIDAENINSSGVIWNKSDPTKVTDPLTYKPSRSDPTSGTIDVPEGQGWESVHYADDLLDVGVKPKFLYKVKFIINPKTGMSADEITLLQKAQFLIKTIDKPTIQMEYQDVNYYNFRTKVLTKVTYSPLNMVFFDDASNYVTNFFVKYLGYISPVFNRYSTELPERAGMATAFKDASASSRTDYSFLDRIIIQQIYRKWYSINNIFVH